jgi:Co/Zn/Cd efflux system component
MACECTQASAQTEQECATFPIALVLNATMFIVGMVAGLWAQFVGLLADELDMLADASTYALALLANSRTTTFKRNATGWSGSLRLILGASILFDIVPLGLFGS